MHRPRVHVVLLSNIASFIFAALFISARDQPSSSNQFKLLCFYLYLLIFLLRRHL